MAAMSLMLSILRNADNKLGRMIGMVAGCMALLLFVTTLQAAVTVNESSGKEYRTGIDLYEKQQYSEAIAHFRKAYELDRRNTPALFAEGLALDKLRKPREAAERFSQVLAAEPKNEKALKLLPEMLLAAGERDRALAAWDKGMAAFPNDYVYSWGKAQVLLKEKQYREALPLLVSASRNAPERLEILEKLALVYRETGDVAHALSTAQAILAKDANNATARLIVADDKRRNGDSAGALDEYRIAARNSESKAYAEHYIAEIQQEQEEREIEDEFQRRLDADTTRTAAPPVTPPSADTLSRQEKTSSTSSLSDASLILVLVALLAIVVIAAVVVSLRRKPRR